MCCYRKTVKVEYRDSKNNKRKSKIQNIGKTKTLEQYKTQKGQNSKTSKVYSMFITLIANNEERHIGGERSIMKYTKQITKDADKDGHKELKELSYKCKAQKN